MSKDWNLKYLGMGHNLFIHSSVYENYKKLVEKIDKDEFYEYFPEKCYEVLSEIKKILVNQP